MKILTSTRSTVTSADGTCIAFRTVGRGVGLIIVGGTLRTGDHYMPLAIELAPWLRVHVVDRRGRGGSGPLGADYSVDKECEDLCAVQAATGATAVFGHSYGGFVALEAACRTARFSHVVVYDPGISIAGSIPMGWIDAYRARLSAADTRGAFVHFVRGIGAAPRVVTLLPAWYLRIVFGLALNGERWKRMEPLLAACASEHEQEALRDDGSADRYASITARVLLLAGSRSPAYLSGNLLDTLRASIRGSRSEIISGLDHFAPDEKAPRIVAERIRSFVAKS